MVSRQKPRKRRKKPPHCSRKAIFRSDHDSDPGLDTPVRPKFLKWNLRLSGQDVPKNMFENELGSAARRAFLASKHNFVKKLNFEIKQICKRPQIILKARLQNWGVWGRRRRIVATQWRKIAPKPLVLKRFASLDLFNFTAMNRHSQDEKKPPRKSLENEGGPQSPKMAFSRKSPISQLRFSEEKFAKRERQFRTTKQVVSENTGRLLTLPGPLINS